MANIQLQEANKEILKVTYIGLAVNITLTLAKIIIGLMSGLMSVVADGVHSLSDMATDVAVLLGMRLGSRKPDSSHPFGHGRMETFAAATVAAALLLVGGFMIYEAADAIRQIHAGTTKPHSLGWLALAVTVLSIISKEWLFWITKWVAVRTHSSAVYANAWHHRSDALSSVAVLIGLGALKWGYEHADQIATIVVALMIIYVGLKVLQDCMNEFSEKAVDERTVEQIQKIIDSEKHICGWHRLRTRSVGREIFLDLHILVEPRMNITDAHDIAERLERALHEQVTRPVNVIIHMEPDLPQLRK
ncbi:MAG: cation diffusion facilitator family transporter [Planctomycetales bacterium]|nr:cation diffusion facilitator family transporter [Planctomycetales bacterium]